MADNVQGVQFDQSAATLATDDIGGVHYPRSKVGFGADGSYQDVSSAAPLPVSASDLPLPTGAATEATLVSVSAELNLIEGYFKAEDAPAVSGDKGLVLLGQRFAADTPTTDQDGDYTILKLDEEGRLKVSSKPASYPDITGDITAIQATIGTPVVGGTVEGDVSRASNVMAFCTGTFAGVNVTFEGSLEASGNTNWFGLQAVRSNANTIETATGALSAQPVYGWELSVNALKRVRVRCTARTSGTQSWRFVQGTYATEPIPAAQVSATQPVSGTVTNNPSKLGTTSRVPVWASGQHIAIGAASAKTAAITGTEVLITVSADCFISIGAQATITATAGAGSMFLAKGGPYLFQITSGQGVAVIQATSGGTMSVLPVA